MSRYVDRTFVDVGKRQGFTPRDPAVTRPGRGRWQVGLPTLLLLMAAIAVWMTCFLNRRQNARLEARIQALLPLVHELVIDDHAKIAVVKLEEYWYDENRWEIYLPPGDYRLCLATRGVDNQGFPTAMKDVPLAAGRYVLSMEQRLEQEIRRIAVFCDGKEQLSVKEPKEWDTGSSSSSGMLDAISHQFPADQPAELLRRQFSRPNAQGRTTSPTGPTEGLLLWIERTAGPVAKP